MTRPTRHPHIESLDSEPENHCPSYQRINAEVRQRGGRKEGGRSGYWWTREVEAQASQRREGGGKKRMGEGSADGGIGREEERNESDMMLLTLCDITEAKNNTEHINSCRIWCMIR